VLETESEVGKLPAADGLQFSLKYLVSPMYDAVEHPPFEESIV